jgi:hypothetical protein
VLQALATPAIALLAAVIGLGQLHTNRTKLALDLFEKRFAVFMDVGDQESSCTLHASVRLPDQAWRGAGFGPATFFRVIC